MGTACCAGSGTCTSRAHWRQMYFFQGMVQDWVKQGYDVSEAEALLPEGQALEAAGRIEELRVLSARIMKALKEAPKIAGHPYHAYEHPSSWEEVKAAMPATKGYKPLSGWQENFARRIYQGWLGQLAGGSFGTALEGYTGSQIARVYGEVRGYITTPRPPMMMWCTSCSCWMCTKKWASP